MPIRAERKALYPINWREISLRIRERANNCCEFCGAPNGEWIRRDKADLNKWFKSHEGVAAGLLYTASVKVVLTVAHLNHDETDCSDDNLKALCQRCHLTYDAQHHASNAAITRSRKKHAAAEAAGQQELFP